MVLIIKQGESKKSIRNRLLLLSKNQKPKGINIYKSVGKIKLKKDPLEIQKELRNEWE